MEAIQLSEATIKLIFELAKSEVPENVEEKDVFEALEKIQALIASLNENRQEANNAVQEKPAASEEDSNNSEIPQILIVDDVGIVTYQLKIMFEKKGFIVSTAKDVYSAIKLFKKYKYPYMIMDLFVSTENEGYLLLDEVKKIIIKEGLETRIVVITASNKAEHRLKCLNRGADKFVVKNPGWQQEISSICDQAGDDSEKEEEKIEDRRRNPQDEMIY